jgi:hypothetical protein
MKILLLLLLMFSVAGATAQEATVPAQPADESADDVTAVTARLELDTTSVSGNRELPKVLVIVPWKNPELVELTGRPLASLVEEVLSPIDPDVFRRQVDYYNALQNDEDAAGDKAGKTK